VTNALSIAENSRAIYRINSPGRVADDTSGRTFACVSALIFVASTAVTVAWCGSMGAMEGMPMPGGWRMSMAWMRMPGQTWAEAASSFLGMWVVMMVAMMLPSVAPVLWRYRKVVGKEVEHARGGTPPGLLTMLLGTGYFLVWAVLGIPVYALGVLLAAVEMGPAGVARAVPIAAGAVVLIAGTTQLTAWKAKHLACCREAPGTRHALKADAGSAWRYGLRLGLHCSYCCGGLTAILLVTGVMDLRAMALVTLAITFERLAPAGQRVAIATGAVAIAAGLIMVARAAGIGWS
jgi:predicted metal-binding membrane protein